MLAAAASNMAVDNLVERLSKADPRLCVVRLGHPARLLPQVRLAHATSLAVHPTPYTGVESVSSVCYMKCAASRLGNLQACRQKVSLTIKLLRFEMWHHNFSQEPAARVYNQKVL